ncbi:MAG: hypothetical protein LBR27_10485 [Bifidobacteriaceae bacterium]|jgi:tetratricopeptide (TPR) repeat protein|nr:hypothetical protein [Bifidobacteriaceae bacterium]
MARSKDQADRDIGTIDRMPYGRARIAAALAEAKRTEAEGPIESLAYALNTLVESYHFGGEPEKAIVPFTKEVALYDAHPELLDDQDRHSLFWSFKWMVASLRDYPTIPAEQIEATLNDMAERFARESISADAVVHARFHWLWHKGDPAAAAAFEEWGRQVRDDISNCRLCSEADRVDYLITTGKPDAALDLWERTQADPSIRQKCHAEPGFVLSVVQLAYAARAEDPERARPGDQEKAIVSYRRAVEFFENNPAAELASAKGRVLEFLARTRNPAAAVRWLEREQAFLLRAEAPLDRLTFLLYAGAGIKVLAEDLGEAARPITLHEVPATTIGELWAWVQPQAKDLADQFDRRNGLPGWSERLARVWSTVPFKERLSLSAVVMPGQTAADGSDVWGGAETVPDGAAAVPARPGWDAWTPGAAPEAECEELLLRAEREARQGHGDLAAAAPLYQRAAAAFERAGRLEEAGFALAEAGQAAGLLGDPEGASACMGRAVRLLRAAGTDVLFLAPVVVVWAGYLHQLGDSEKAGEALSETGTAVANALLGLPGELGETAAAERKERLLDLQTDVDYARVPVSEAVGRVTEAAELAEGVATYWAQRSQFAKAAAAFEAAGQAVLKTDPERAAYLLESATEGYQLASRRTERLKVAGVLLDLLNRLGRPEDAARLTETL